MCKFELDKIAEDLSDFNSIFYHIWNISYLTETQEIPTIGVTYDSEADKIKLYYNPSFWEQLTYTDKLFIICHEMMHVILNHPERISTLNKRYGEKYSNTQQIGNIAADIVVNEYLLKNFGFKKEDISISKNLIWLDKFFDSSVIKQDEIMEYYFYALIKNNSVSEKDHSIDQHFHKILEEEDNTSITKKVSNNLEKNLCEVDRKETANEIKEIVDAKEYGLTPIGKTFTYKNESTKILKKWSTIFKKLYKQFEEKPEEQWTRENRRFTTFSNDLFIPSEFEQEEKEIKKINAFLFMDISASCINLKDYFLKAAYSIPLDKFNLLAYTFDTQVYKIKIDPNKKNTNIYGGGGTYFPAIEKEIQRVCKENNTKYPEVVMVFTDGESCSPQAEIPERWHWFYISHFSDVGPEYSNKYDLETIL